MAIDPHAVYEGPQAEAYERYVRENWDKLAPWEQQQAREFLVGSKHPGRVVQSGSLVAPSPKTFLNDAKKDDDRPDLFWTIRAGWVCIFATLLLSPILFGIIGIALGIHIAKKGDSETGILQIGLTLLAAVLSILIYLGFSQIVDGILPNPAGPFG